MASPLLWSPPWWHRSPRRCPLAAHEEKTGDITIVHPWSRPAPQGQNGVIYLEIRNGGAVDDRLIGVSMPLAEKVELHRSTMEDGIHRMEKVESIVVPAGGTVELAPGGLHVMLIGLKFMLMAEETISRHSHLRAGGRHHGDGCRGDPRRRRPLKSVTSTATEGVCSDACQSPRRWPLSRSKR